MSSVIISNQFTDRFILRENILYLSYNKNNRQIIFTKKRMSYFRFLLIIHVKADDEIQPGKVIPELFQEVSMALTTNIECENRWLWLRSSRTTEKINAQGYAGTITFQLISPQQIMKHAELGVHFWIAFFTDSNFSQKSRRCDPTGLENEFYFSAPLIVYNFVHSGSAWKLAHNVNLLLTLNLSNFATIPPMISGFEPLKQTCPQTRPT